MDMNAHTYDEKSVLKNPRFKRKNHSLAGTLNFPKFKMQFKVPKNYLKILASEH